MKRILITLLTIVCITAHAQSPHQLQAQIIVLQKQMAALQSNNALKLAPFVTVDPNPQVGVRGPNITFSGANIHIVSGSGATNDNGNPFGLGNLIIGYNEDPGTQGTPLYAGQRSGSHNLIIGRWHKFFSTAFGGFVAGDLNTIEGGSNSILSGYHNRTLSNYTAIVGGMFNQNSGPLGVIVGGGYNLVDVAGQSVILGGSGNAVTGQNSVVLGLSGVTESGDYKVTQ